MSLFILLTAVIRMEGGSDNDLLSLDQPVSTENGDKSLEGEGEKRGKGKDSEFRMCTTAKLSRSIFCAGSVGSEIFNTLMSL